MRMAFTLLALLVACKNDATSTPEPGTAVAAAASPAPMNANTPPSDWQPLDIDLSWEAHAQTDRQDREGTARLTVMAPAGSTFKEGWITIPGNGVSVELTHKMEYFDPAYTYPDHIVPVTERALVLPGCKTRRGSSGFGHSPWNGKPVAGAPDGVTVCVGPSWSESSPRPGCHIVASYVESLGVDCGTGTVCADEATALTLARVCASLRAR